MATRGCIARRTGANTFTGIYHHWDSYPSGLGKKLFELYNGFFKRDLDAMLRTLLEEHPAGWSTIVEADFTLPAGYCNTSPDESIQERVERPKRPQCYCHGDRHEDSDGTMTESTSEGCDYAYIFDVQERVGDHSANTPAPRMLIASIYRSAKPVVADTFGAWRTVAVIDLSGVAPDWEHLTEE